MKKIILIILCFMIFTTLSACGKKQENNSNHSINDIPTASADDNNDTDDNSDKKDDASNENSNDDPSYSEEETEEYTVPDTNKKDLRSEKERIEINNNLRDAQELIDNECYEDAMMIIQSLKTRKLSDDENKKLIELQEQMMRISD